jgi:nicotinate-nucleotide adenylyltransferase
VTSICLYGGTFDPIHVAHLINALYACEKLAVNAFVFIPAPTPPHKTHITQFEHRFNMISLAIKEEPVFSVTRLEQDRGGVSYTIDTVRHFNAKGLYDSVYFLMGSDSLLEITTWRQWEMILDECRVVVMKRPGFDPELVEDKIAKKVMIIDTPLLEISATEIRERVRKGQSIRYFTPEPVIEYIREKGLYKD